MSKGCDQVLTNEELLMEKIVKSSPSLVRNNYAETRFYFLIETSK